MYKQKVVFLGTPDFAVASLAALLTAGIEVLAVVTAPDKQAGRGLQLQQSAVKQFALEKGLKVLQPERLKSAQFLEELTALNADLFIVVAFRMLPEVVWNMPKMGTVNVHGSLLPKYRGAAPINWALINGETETGVTTFKLKHQIDTGNILLQKKIDIAPDDNFATLYNKLKVLGAECLVETVEALFNNRAIEFPQENLLTQQEIEATHAPKIFTSVCEIGFSQPVEKINNLVRGLAPHPAAFTKLNGKVFKIFKAEVEKTTISPEYYGKAFTDGKTYLKFGAYGGYLVAHEIQLEGKKRMTAQEFLRGYRF
jgi:methionyl-tRNA formyltransferase